MTEAEWLAGVDAPQLITNLKEHAGTNVVSDRKVTLFASACCWRVMSLIGAKIASEAIEWLECVADGRPTERDAIAIQRSLRQVDKGISSWRERMALGAVRDACQALTSGAFDSIASQVTHTACTALASNDEPLERAEKAVHVGLVRDIFGNPFRPATFSPLWRTDTAVALARQMYDAREFSAMPILADALQDAGCDNEVLLDHCRDPKQVHVRGCWVVDLVLGKQ
jgi:hypothetical protein